jgi:hypothetical protein
MLLEAEIKEKIGLIKHHQQSSTAHRKDIEIDVKRARVN